MGATEVLISGQRKCAADPNRGDFQVSWDPPDRKKSPPCHLSYSGWPATAPCRCAFLKCTHRLPADLVPAPQRHPQGPQVPCVCRGDVGGPSGPHKPAPSPAGRCRTWGAAELLGNSQNAPKRPIWGGSARRGPVQRPGVGCLGCAGGGQSAPSTLSGRGGAPGARREPKKTANQR